MSSRKESAQGIRWEAAGLGALGLLVGNLVGLAGAGVVKGLIAALFAFTGGSVIAFREKIPQADRPAMGKIILAFSILCFLGLYSGIAVTTYRLLGEPPKVADARRLEGVIERLLSRTSQGDVAADDALALVKAYREILESLPGGYLDFARSGGLEADSLGSLRSRADEIDLQRRGQDITLEDAYRGLRTAVLDATQPKEPNKE